MSYLPSLPGNATLVDVLGAYPNTAKPLLDYHEVLLRGPSPLSVADRELIAAYVSGLNGCDYCHGAHTAVAGELGVSESSVKGVLDDIDAASVDERIKPLLHYVGKLTEVPTRMTEADAQAVFDAGWSEQALHDAVAVCGLFNFMNRMVEGLGVVGDAEHFAFAGKLLAEGGYAGVKGLLEDSQK